MNAAYERPVASGRSKLASVSMRMLEGNATPHLTQHDAVKRDVRTAQPGYVFPEDALRTSQPRYPASRVC